MTKKYVPLRKAMAALGMSNVTLRKYADEGRIESIRNPGNQRLFNIEDYLKAGSGSTRILYARVRNRKQVDDLARQREHLQRAYPEAEIITDIGSGLNFKRKGLLSILDRLMQGDKLEIVVAYKDRLARFGFDLIKYLVEYNGGTVMVLNDSASSPEGELVQDILSIITLFSGRINGLRKYHNQVKEDKDIPDLQTRANR